VVQPMSTKITDYSADVPLVQKMQTVEPMRTQTIPSNISEIIAARARIDSRTISPEVSQVLFSDPKEFLQVLKKDFNRIKKSGATVITKDDLQLYSENGIDAEGRAAASIAVKHYDQLQGIAYGSKAGTPIAEGDISRDIDYVTGNTDGIISEKNESSDKLALSATSMALMCLRGARKAEEIPYLPYALGAVAGGLMIFDGFMLRDTFKQKTWTHKVAEEDKKMVKSWL
jgi:hypothetical protein